MTSGTPYTPISSAPTTTTTTTSTPLSANLDYISRAKHRLYSTLATRRPWAQLLNYHAFSLPAPLSVAFSRLKTNLSYFRVNFAMFILLVLFLSLLWHPISLIVFLAMMVAWLFLFFLRDEPLVIFRRTVDDRVVLAVLAVVTVVLLLLTGATWNIVGAVAGGAVVVVVYSVVRRTDDLFLDEEEAAGAGILAGRVGHGPAVY